MNVKELIESLKNMDQQAKIFHLWDGKLRTEIAHVYMGKTGKCVTADYDEVAYDDEARPIDGPDKKSDRYWSTPAKETKGGNEND